MTAAEDPESPPPRSDRETIETILRGRARALARERQSGTPRERIEVIVFQLAWEDYAVETRFVREVYPLKELTPIPCTPPFILGVINLRGELCPVVDLKRLFGLPQRDLTNATRAIVLQDPTMEIAIIADVIVGVRAVDRDAIQAAPAMLSGISGTFLRGVAPGRLIILDAPAILADPGIIVNEHVDN